jgi:hypothetical protein
MISWPIDGIQVPSPGRHQKGPIADTWADLSPGPGNVKPGDRYLAQPHSFLARDRVLRDRPPATGKHGQVAATIIGSPGPRYLKNR